MDIKILLSGLFYYVHHLAGILTCLELTLGVGTKKHLRPYLLKVEHKPHNGPVSEISNGEMCKVRGFENFFNCEVTKD